MGFDYGFKWILISKYLNYYNCKLFVILSSMILQSQKLCFFLFFTITIGLFVFVLNVNSFVKYIYIVEARASTKTYADGSQTFRFAICNVLFIFH